MNKFLVAILFLIPSLILGRENPPVNQSNFNLHFGFEISELLQNRFRNLGPRNFTFLAGQEFRSGKWQDLGWRVLLMNVELSQEHLQGNSFIKGDKTDLEGALTVGRVYLDWYPVSKELSFLRFRPILSLGTGYNRNVIQESQIYDLNGITLDAGFRLQTEFFRRVFIEFPVADAFVYLWKNRSAKGAVNDARIDYPEWGMIFLWVNAGFRINF